MAAEEAAVVATKHAPVFAILGATRSSAFALSALIEALDLTGEHTFPAVPA
jgi:hypothetical protein